MPTMDEFLKEQNAKTAAMTVANTFGGGGGAPAPTGRGKVYKNIPPPNLNRVWGGGAGGNINQGVKNYQNRRYQLPRTPKMRGKVKPVTNINRALNRAVNQSLNAPTSGMTELAAALRGGGESNG